MLKIYDIQCTNCGHIKEVLIEDKKFPACDKCGAPTKRIYSTFNFKLIYNNQTQSCGWASTNYDSNHYWDDTKGK